ncbi:MAG TPA: hypothetical protein VF707_19055 [Ardenticatenaceae bacterium]|jgi:hypothetical protein
MAINEDNERHDAHRKRVSMKGKWGRAGRKTVKVNASKLLTPRGRTQTTSNASGAVLPPYPGPELAPAPGNGELQATMPSKVPEQPKEADLMPTVSEILQEVDKHVAAMREQGVSRDQLRGRLRELRHEILQEAIANGTALDDEWCDD